MGTCVNFEGNNVNSHDSSSTDLCHVYVFNCPIVDPTRFHCESELDVQVGKSFNFISVFFSIYIHNIYTYMWDIGVWPEV